MRIGLIGIGAIGGYLAGKLKEEVCWVCEADLEFAERRVREMGLGAKVVGRPEEGVDLVVEAASQKAVGMLAGVLEYADVMVLSVGALADEGLLGELEGAAEKSGKRIYVPSGAVGGLDAVRSARDVLREVVLETRKPPKSLSMEETGKEVVVFEGSAREACKTLPKNVNVAATLALCGIGFEKTRVRVVSDPGVKRNTHTIKARGKMGEFEFRVENEQSEENPKTSALAALSALRKINEIGSAMQIG